LVDSADANLRKERAAAVIGYPCRTLGLSPSRRIAVIEEPVHEARVKITGRVCQDERRA
jgi:hypothetical protein